jgi:hypothetical protein
MIYRQTTTDQSIRVIGIFAEARSTAARKNRCDALENVKARHNTLGETTVGLRNIVTAIHFSAHVYSIREPKILFRHDT